MVSSAKRLALVVCGLIWIDPSLVAAAKEGAAKKRDKTTLLGRADALLKKKRPKRAFALYRRALRRGASSKAHAGMAECLVLLGRLKAAFPHFRNALELDPKDIRTLVRFANVLTWTKKAANETEAMMLLDKHLKKHPDDDVVRLERAKLRSWAKLIDEAVADYSRVLKRYPRDEDVRIKMATVLSWSSKRAQRDEAIKIYGELIKRGKRDDLLLKRAAVHSWNGETRRAVNDYNRYLALHPGDAAARLKMAAVLSWSKKETDRKQALKLYDAHVQRYPNDLKALLARGRVRYWTRQNSLAIADFRRYLRRKRSTDVRLELADILVASGRLREAAGEYWWAKGRGRRYRPRAEFGLAKIMRRSRQFKQAERELDRLRSAAIEAELLNSIELELAILYNDTGRKAEAIDLLTAIKRRAPDFKEAQQTLAQLK